MKANLTFRLLSIGVIVFSLGHHMNAQNSLTAHAGFGSSNIEVRGTPFDPLINPYIQPIAQYNAGIQYAHALSRHFSVITGVQYASRGFAAREDFNVNVFGLDLPVGAEVVTRLAYVEVPVMAQVNITESGVSPYVKAGISAGYAFNAKMKPQVNALITWSLPQININLKNDLFNRVDVAALAGAGVSIPVESLGALHFDLTYRHSLNDMFQDKITNIQIRSHGVTAGVGFTMNF